MIGANQRYRGGGAAAAAASLSSPQLSPIYISGRDRSRLDDAILGRIEHQAHVARASIAARESFFIRLSRSFFFFLLSFRRTRLRGEVMGSSTLVLINSPPSAEIGGPANFFGFASSHCRPFPQQDFSSPPIICLPLSLSPFLSCCCCCFYLRASELRDIFYPLRGVYNAAVYSRPARNKEVASPALEEKNVLVFTGKLRR